MKPQYYDNNRTLSNTAEMPQTIASKGKIDSLTFCDVYHKIEDLGKKIVKVVTTRWAGHKDSFLLEYSAAHNSLKDYTHAPGPTAKYPTPMWEKWSDSNHFS